MQQRSKKDRFCARCYAEPICLLVNCVYEGGKECRMVQSAQMRGRKGFGAIRDERAEQLRIPGLW